MKAKDKFLSAVVLTAAALCSSCSTDDLTAQQQGQGEAKTVSLTATLGETQTRAGIGNRSGNTHTLYWHDSDQILVQTKSTADNSYSGAKFDIATGTATGVTSATFNGYAGAKAQIGTYAVYPYDGQHKFTGEKSLSFHLPNTYNYSTVESGIFPKDGAYRTTNTHVPMLGTISDGTASFKHLGGLLVIRIDKMPHEKGLIFVKADQKLCGDFAVEDLSASDAKIVTEAVSSGSEYNEVEFSFTEATRGGVGIFYLPVPTGEYTNLQIELDAYNGAKVVTATYGSLKVDRADIIAIPVYLSADGTSYSCDYVVSDHKFVDLCLPSGTLWAETNVGAETAADDGCYFAWGETDMTTKSSYSWDTYKWPSNNGSTFTKYTKVGKTVLDKEDDAANMNWGAYCRMPSIDEFTELCNSSYCTWTWTTQTTSSGSTISGYKVTSVKNGNSIFLPASGYRSGNNLNNPGLSGSYWSSSLSPYDSGYASVLNLNSDNTNSNFHDRCWGHTVRPVAKTYSTVSGSTVPDMSISGFDSTWE